MLSRDNGRKYPIFLKLDFYFCKRMNRNVTILLTNMAMIVILKYCFEGNINYFVMFDFETCIPNLLWE